MGYGLWPVQRPVRGGEGGRGQDQCGSQEGPPFSWGRVGDPTSKITKEMRISDAAMEEEEPV